VTLHGVAFKEQTMYAISITVKLLVTYFSFKYGDAGRASRPWIIGIIFGSVFGAFDLSYVVLDPQTKAVLFAAYLIAAIVIMQIYFRTRNIALSLAMIGIGTAIMFFGIPFGLMPWLNR
jgi:hypothetical protein